MSLSLNPESVLKRLCAFGGYFVVSWLIIQQLQRSYQATFVPDPYFNFEARKQAYETSLGNLIEFIGPDEGDDLYTLWPPLTAEVRRHYKQMTSLRWQRGKRPAK